MTTLKIIKKWRQTGHGALVDNGYKSASFRSSVVRKTSNDRSYASDFLLLMLPQTYAHTNKIACKNDCRTYIGKQYRRLYMVLNSNQ